MAQETTSSNALVHLFNRHRSAVLIALGATVVTGGALYYYSKSSQAGPSDEDTATSGQEKERRKPKKKKNKKSAAAKASDEQSKESGTDKKKTSDKKSEEDSALLNIASEEIEKFTPERRTEIATKLKEKGNENFTAHNFKEAVSYYTKAIECQEEAVYYSNRAACYSNLGDVEATIRDCTDALRLDPLYLKALNRRGSAKELQNTEESLFDSLCDFTTVAILDGFKNNAYSKSIDRVMKKFAQTKATRLRKDRVPSFPSLTFIKAYFESFRKEPKLELPEKPGEGDLAVSKVLDALEKHDFEVASSTLNEAIKQSFTSTRAHAMAYNMRGTFNFVMGNIKEAQEDLQKSLELDPTYTQTLVKKASLFVELGDVDSALKAFDEALKIDGDNSDVFYHRGQVYFITQQYDMAIENYKKAEQLDSNFIFSQIQLAVAYYKKGQVERAGKMFKKMMESSGDTSGEAHNYYGELLLDQKRYDEALEEFEKAIQIEKSRPAPQNVLPMVNKALALFQSKQALDPACDLCRQALEIDAKCDVAVGTLAQLLMQANKLEEAIEMFARSADLARTESELMNMLSFESATRAQLKFLQAYPQHASVLGFPGGQF